MANATRAMRPPLVDCTVESAVGALPANALVKLRGLSEAFVSE